MPILLILLGTAAATTCDNGYDSTTDCDAGSDDDQLHGGASGGDSADGGAPSDYDTCSAETETNCDAKISLPARCPSVPAPDPRVYLG